MSGEGGVTMSVPLENRRERRAPSAELNHLAHELIRELKAVEVLAEVHKAQVIFYLKTTGRTLGLLINFNVPLLRNGIKRIICT